MLVHRAFSVVSLRLEWNSLTHTPWTNLLSDSGNSLKEDWASKGSQPPWFWAKISRVPVQTSNENMCNPGSIEESPNVQVTSLGNNSSSKSLHKTLKDSVQTHLTLNIAGGTTVYILLIRAMVVMFFIYKAQKTALSTVHTRLHWVNLLSSRVMTITERNRQRQNSKYLSAKL